MKSNKLLPFLKWSVVNICRMLLASAMIFSGAVKAIDPRGTEYKIKDYAIAFGLDDLMIFYLPLVLSIALALLEFGLGINLFFGSNRRWTSRVLLMLFVVFTPLTLYIAIANPVSDCGCFGDLWVLTNWQSFAKNVLFLTCAIVVCFGYKLQTRLITEHNQWIITTYTWLFGFVLSLYCVYTLPVMDFRPYHIGADLHAKMQWGDNDEIPQINDLLITHPHTGEDLTDSIVQSDGWKFIIVLPHVEHADDGVMDRLTELTEYCQAHNYKIVALTASNDSLINYWCDITGAEYPFLIADEIPLKTMIRSNPGLILLNGSVVANKWASTQIPGANDLNAPLEDLDWAHKQYSTYADRFIILMKWYLFPLLLCFFLDRIWFGTRLYKNRKNKYNNNNLKTKKMRKHIVAGNWKMNKSLQEGVALATELKEMLAAQKPNCEVIIGTPFIHLATVSELLKDSVIAVSAENCANKESGAYTGEVSASMVKSTGAEYVILGHSERREYYHETPEILKEKVDLALANGLKVIFCIGESLAEREANEQEAVCKAELAGSVFHLTAEQWKNVVIAYEPIWAIGTGKTATAEQAEEIHAYIRSCVAEVYGAEIADETSILYGGSCKASNAPELFGKPNIDGGLIGGASLKADDFKGIIDAWN